MRRQEQVELSATFKWKNLSSNLRTAVVLDNALPEVYPELKDASGNPKKNPMTRRMDEGIDKEREETLATLEGRMSEADRILFKDYKARKSNYFVAYAKRYYSLVKSFREQGMLGKENRGWQAVARHSLVMSELAGSLAEGLKNHGIELNPIVLRIAGLLHDMVKRKEMEHLRELQMKNLALDEGQRLSENQIYEQMADFGDRQFTDLVGAKGLRAELVNLMPDLKDDTKFKEFVEAIRNIGEVGSLATVQESGMQPDSLVLQDYKLLDNNTSRILFYLDQIIKHTAIVSIKERFADARKRYASPGSRQSAQFIQMDNREKIVLRLEEELAAILGIRPQEMQEYLAKLFFEKLYQTK